MDLLDKKHEEDFLTKIIQWYKCTKGKNILYLKRSKLYICAREKMEDGKWQEECRWENWVNVPGALKLSVTQVFSKLF